MNSQMLLVIIQAVSEIFARHAESGSTTPLTNEDVHTQLLAELTNGQSAIAMEFAAKGWEVPK